MRMFRLGFSLLFFLVLVGCDLSTSLTLTEVNTPQVVVTDMAPAEETISPEENSTATPTENSTPDEANNANVTEVDGFATVSNGEYELHVTGVEAGLGSSTYQSLSAFGAKLTDESNNAPIVVRFETTDPEILGNVEEACKLEDSSGQTYTPGFVFGGPTSNPNSRVCIFGVPTANPDLSFQFTIDDYESFDLGQLLAGD